MAIVFSFSIPFETTLGHRLALCGSVPQLGAWNVARAKGMVWSDNNVWRTEWRVARRLSEESDKEYVHVAYKYAIIDTQGVTVGWESGENHILSIELNSVSRGGSVTIIVRDEWNGGHISPTLSVFSHMPEGCASSARNFTYGSVAFVVAGPPSPFGCTGLDMVVVGNIPELGSWEISKGLVMEAFAPMGGIDIIWIARFVVTGPVQNPIEYKYVLRSKHNTGFLWEKGINRVKRLPIQHTPEEATYLFINFDSQYRKPDVVSESWLSTGYSGLVNTFASCALNAVTQVVYHLPKFREVVWQAAESHSIKGDLSKVIGEIFKSLWQNTVNPTVKEVVPLLGLSEDPFEFLSLLIFGLKSDFGAETYLIDDLFIGKQKFIRKHPDQSILEREECFLAVSLVIEGLPNLFASYSHYVSPNMPNSDRIDVTTELTKLPPILVFHLERVKYDAATNKGWKVSQKFEFPARLSLYKVPYRLHGIVVHRGNNSSSDGHYYAFICLKNIWYKFDDEVIQVFPDENEVLQTSFGGGTSDTAYLLVYVQDDNPLKTNKSAKE